MTLVILSALGVGVGLVGLVTGLQGQRLSLEAVFKGLVAAPNSTSRPLPLSWRRDIKRFDRRMAVRIADVDCIRGYLVGKLDTRLALSNVSLEELLARCVASGVIGGLLPVFVWMVTLAGGVALPLVGLIPSVASLAVGAALLPIAELNAEANRERRHARRVLCSFLDLVVLALAGGMGIESALVAAAQLGENKVSRRMFAVLTLSRDTGEPPWEALARFGEALGIEEFGELAASAGLAGMEGAKIRATLVARATTIRRHDLANAEAEANVLTERLFLPGAFLLVGFLIFIGYPAFTRIAAGF